jgi:hypothetical protein
LFYCGFKEKLCAMDWAKAIERNQVALARIVAEIIALVGWVAGGRLDRLPHSLYLAAERLLRPTESALRRLIVIAARGLVVKPSLSRPMTKGKVMRAGAKGLTSFPLFDTRKRFDFIEPENPLLVMVKTYSSNPFNPFEQNTQRRVQEPADRDYTLSLARRLAAVKQALETLPQQAQRMARWQAKRKTMDKPKFTSPLRPGRPPGYRGEPESKIDFILQETHGLACDALRVDSS